MKYRIMSLSLYLAFGLSLSSLQPDFFHALLIVFLVICIDVVSSIETLFKKEREVV